MSRWKLSRVVLLSWKLNKDLPQKLIKIVIRLDHKQGVEAPPEHDSDTVTINNQ